MNANEFLESINNQRELDKLFVVVNRIIWNHSNALSSSLNDKWNLIFLLHHEIIREYSSVVGGQSRYYQYQTSRSSNSLQLNKLLVNPFICNCGIHTDSFLLKFILKMLTSVLAFLSITTTGYKPLYISLDPVKEVSALSNLINSLNSLLHSKGYQSTISSESLLEKVKLNIITINWYSFFLCPRILLTGSRAPFHSRLIACNTLKTKGIVISSTHGEQYNLIIDEPIIHYSECTLCNVLIQHGSIKLPPHHYPKHSPSVVFNISSRKINRLVSVTSKNIESSKNDSEERTIFYIPTLLSGDQYYFPYRQLPDESYVYHWHSLLSSNPEIMICIHPGSNFGAVPSSFNVFLSNWKHRVCTRPLSCLLEDVSCRHFIIDYISTVSCQLIASYKNILFVDIGMRNLDPTYLKSLRTYSYWFDMTSSLAYDRLSALIPSFVTRSIFSPQIRHARNELLQYSLR
jgi:hypothetical protein